MPKQKVPETLTDQQLVEVRRHIANSIEQDRLSEVVQEASALKGENDNLRASLDAQGAAEGKVFAYLETKLRASLAQINELNDRFVRDKRAELARLHEIDDQRAANVERRAAELAEVRRKRDEVVAQAGRLRAFESEHPVLTAKAETLSSELEAQREKQRLKMEKLALKQKGGKKEFMARQTAAITGARMAAMAAVEKNLSPETKRAVGQNARLLAEIEVQASGTADVGQRITVAGDVTRELRRRLRHATVASSVVAKHVALSQRRVAVLEARLEEEVTSQATRRDAEGGASRGADPALAHVVAHDVAELAAAVEGARAEAAEAKHEAEAAARRWEEAEGAAAGWAMAVLGSFQVLEQRARQRERSRDEVRPTYVRGWSRCFHVQRLTAMLLSVAWPRALGPHWIATGRSTMLPGRGGERGSSCSRSWCRRCTRCRPTARSTRIRTG